MNQISPEERRGEVVSSYLIAVYLGISLPIVGIGLLSARIGPPSAHIVFAAAIVALAVAAFPAEWGGPAAMKAAE